MARTNAGPRAVTRLAPCAAPSEPQETPAHHIMHRLVRRWSRGRLERAVGKVRGASPARVRHDSVFPPQRPKLLSHHEYISRLPRETGPDLSFQSSERASCSELDERNEPGSSRACRHLSIPLLLLENTGPDLHILPLSPACCKRPRSHTAQVHCFAFRAAPPEITSPLLCLLRTLTLHTCLSHALRSPSLPVSRMGPWPHEECPFRLLNIQPEANAEEIRKGDRGAVT